MTKQLAWEEEFDLYNTLEIQHHLKVVIPRPDSPRPYKISVAWVRRIGKRKYEADVVGHTTHYDNQTFRSLKAAKAWCLAVYSMKE